MATDPKDERPLAADERWALYTKRGSLRTIYDCTHKPTLCRPDARYYTVRRVRIVPVESENDLRAENAKLRALIEKATPFVGWTGAPDGLVDEMEAAIAEKGSDA